MSDSNQPGSFFGFTRFVTPNVVAFLFVFGALLTVVAAVDFAITPVKSYEFIGKNALIATGAGIASLLLWRITCELMVVVFQIHDQLKRIAGKP